MTRYSTRSQAIHFEIVEPLGEYADDHDIDAIADEVLGNYKAGYAIKDDVDFWAVVERNAY